MPLDTHRDERALEIGKYGWVAAYAPGINPTADAECGQGTGRLADVPFHGMEPVTAIGDMSDAQTLAGRQQVLHSLREQRAQWDLKWIGRDVKVSASCGAGMEVYPVTPDADRVGEGLCAIGARTSLYPDVRFQDGELGDDPAAFPNIRGRRQAVRSTKHFRTEPQPGISHSAVRTRCICLQPVDEAER